MRRWLVYWILAVIAGVIIVSYLIIFNVFLTPENIKVWLKTRIESAVPSSNVKIKAVERDVFNFLKVKEFELKKRGHSPFLLHVGEADIYFRLIDLARGEIERVNLRRIYLEKNGKFNIQSIEGNLVFRSERLRSEEFTFQGLLGKGIGWMEFGMKDSTFRLSLQMDLLDLYEVSRSYYPEKIVTDGTLRGNIWLKVRGNRLELLQGEFNSITSGKIKVVSKEELLSQFPVGTNIDLLSVALDSMKDYQYDKAQIKLENDREDVVIFFLFQGPQGKREFEIHWHTSSE